jgi:hypothetical protein
MNEDNVRDPGLLSDEFKFIMLSTAVADWLGVHPHRTQIWG